MREGLTELVGEAGACKSQLAFQLLLQVQLPLPPSSPPLPSGFDRSPYGLDGCGVYLSTEGSAPIGRLQQLQDGIRRRLPWTADYDFLDSAFVWPLRTVEELEAAVERLPQRVAEHRLRLVVLDSIAGLFRLDDSASSASSSSAASTKAECLFRLSAALRRLSAVHHLCVVVCNQVTDLFHSGDQQALERWAMESSGRLVVPALGLTWANCINCRVGLTRKGGGRGGGGAGQDTADLSRSMEVLFAPHLPQRRLRFEVDGEGVRGIEGTLEDSGASVAPLPNRHFPCTTAPSPSLPQRVHDRAPLSAVDLNTTLSVSFIQR